MTKISKKNIVRYFLRTPTGDYGSVALELGDKWVLVMAESSFGTFGYQWNATGCNPIDFLCNLRFHYAMQKFRGSAYQVFDRDAQKKVLQRRTIARRRARTLDAETARECFDEIEHVCSADSLDTYWAHLYHSDLVTHLFDNDFGDLSAEKRPDPQCVGFWDEIWVPLMNHLRAESAAQAQVGSDAQPMAEAA